MSTHSSRSIEHLLHEASTFPINFSWLWGSPERQKQSQAEAEELQTLGCQGAWMEWWLTRLGTRAALHTQSCQLALLPACPEICSLSLVSLALTDIQVLISLWLLPLQPYSLLIQDPEVLKCSTTRARFLQLEKGWNLHPGHLITSEQYHLYLNMRRWQQGLKK